MPDLEVELGVTEFVALLNQSLEYAFSGVVIIGELANLRVSKNRWLYFDLKDENSTVKFFGTIYNLPGPLEDGMMLKVRGLPKLHNLYGFSVNVSTIQLAGEGSIKRAAQLLQAKLGAEGLFDESRKRALPYPPSRIGLVASLQSAAYADFIKIINARWQGLNIEVIDVQVQGEVAPLQITEALGQFNEMPLLPEVIIVIRGGGSAEDLAAFSTEQVTRAVAASRVPTLVAIGHEVDLSLAELAADRRASTPSNAAELLVPDKTVTLQSLRGSLDQLIMAGQRQFVAAKNELSEYTENLNTSLTDLFTDQKNWMKSSSKLLAVMSPHSILQRGYAIVRSDKKVIRRAGQLLPDDIVDIELGEGHFSAEVTKLGLSDGQRK